MFKKSLILSYSGIDGSGKTSIIDGVSGVLESNGYRTKYVWLRYNHYITKILLIFCRLIGLTKYKTIDGVRVGHHDFYKSKIISYAFIWLTYIDTLIVSLLLVYLPRLFSNVTIICDRWILDILIDLEIDTKINLDDTFILKMFFALIPDNAKCFIIYRDYDLVHDAREEHKIDKNFKDRYELYYSREHTRFDVIKNTKDLDVVIGEAINMAGINDK